jgi:transcriptional regulator with XRE-family HTH domain
MNIGKTIQSSRKKNNLTQKQLGELVGKEKSYISRIERGAIYPGMQLFINICKVLKITLKQGSKL